MVAGKLLPVRTLAPRWRPPPASALSIAYKCPLPTASQCPLRCSPPPLLLPMSASLRQPHPLPTPHHLPLLAMADPADPTPSMEYQAPDMADLGLVLGSDGVPARPHQCGPSNFGSGYWRRPAAWYSSFDSELLLLAGAAACRRWIEVIAYIKQPYK